MGQSASTEAIIAIASTLKDQLTSLYKAYLRLPQVIEEEHAAIKSGGIGLIEKTCELKVKLGEEIETYFGTMRQAGDELKRLCDRLLGGPSRSVVSLRDCVDALDALAANIGGDGLGAQVLRHQNQGLRQLQQEFETHYKRVQPLIEMNKYLTERMLENHNESYHFWLSIVEETESAYNAKGVQKVQGRNSAFKVTA